MPEAIISAKGTEAPTVRSGRFTTLYDPKYVPVDLRQAHEHLDKIVDVAFGAGKWLKDDDSARLKILFDLY